MPKIYSTGKKEEIRERLMAEALERIRNDGYKQLRIEDLTKKVGIAQGTFYHFFKSKEALLVELAMAYERQIKEYVAAIISVKGKLTAEDFEKLYLQMFLHDDQNVFRFLKRSDIEHLMNRLPVDISKLLESSRTTMLATMEHLENRKSVVDMTLAFNLIQLMNLTVENRDLLHEGAYEATLHLLIKQLVSIIFEHH